MAKLKSLDELWGADSNPGMGGKLAVQDLAVTDLAPFVGHPFTLYTGERLDDMVENVKAKGVLVPIIVRKREANEGEESKGGCVLEILAGHNRCEASKLAGKPTVPALVLENVSDEDAMAIVVETNLLQRSFADMRHSEKAAVIALHHGKMFSQGKRNDILEALQILEQGQKIPIDGTPDEANGEGQAQNGWNSAKAVGEAYGLSKNSVSRYLRVNGLAAELKEMLDNDEIGMLSAVSVSYLSEHEQILLADIMRDHGFSLGPKKAGALRQASKEEGLNTISIKAILADAKISASKRLPAIRFKDEVYSRYFTEETTAEEVSTVVEEALQYYFEHGPGKENGADGDNGEDGGEGAGKFNE